MINQLNAWICDYCSKEPCQCRTTTPQGWGVSAIDESAFQEALNYWRRPKVVNPHHEDALRAVVEIYEAARTGQPPRPCGAVHPAARAAIRRYNLLADIHAMIEKELVFDAPRSNPTTKGEGNAT